MKADEQIASSVKLTTSENFAKRLNIPERHLMPYGRHIAKINSALLKNLAKEKDGKLIVVTAMSPTPSGEGKTTLAIGLAQALKLLKKKAIACIRQPSLGPFFGAKGGATGSGYSQVLPVEEIALHFTGDDHAVVSAHNLISSIIDNHIYHGNKLRINPDRILWKRVSDINDRALRKIK
ncbi:MAG: formate--tetrahydrofolate ligase, partial [Candidatus Omnitrophica bacterium]|nr:formate--tetrahydrofolate ligase [Candidatus Omnitrophota bacterium]